MSITITFTGHDDQPNPHGLAAHLFTPTATGAVYPLAFRFDLPTGGSRLDGTTKRRALIITTSQTRVTDKLVRIVASRAAAIMRCLYEESDLPVMLEKSLITLVEREVRLGGPYRSFRFDHWNLPSGDGWGYSARGCGGYFNQPPLHDHLRPDGKSD